MMTSRDLDVSELPVYAQNFWEPAPTSFTASVGWMMRCYMPSSIPFNLLKPVNCQFFHGTLLPGIDLSSFYQERQDIGDQFFLFLKIVTCLLALSTLQPWSHRRLNRNMGPYAEHGLKDDPGSDPDLIWFRQSWAFQFFNMQIITSVTNNEFTTF